MSGETLGTPLDYGVIAVYFVAVLGFGSFFGRHSRSTRDFFFAGQRFSWWLVGLSMVASLVGSYSFVKYSAVGYRHGLSSSLAYLNDWIWMPLFMFGWLPIIYFGRIRSVPEYFQRRFDRPTRVAATAILLVYMIGYIGINFYTLGVALNRVVGWDVFPTAVAVGVATAIYVTAGGQSAVIMTDLLQGVLLLLVGLALLLVGFHVLGGGDILAGLQAAYNGLTPAQRQALPGFNRPPEFNFVGVFWQDGFANSVFFYFMNQGILMRFLAVRSPAEGRKAAIFTVMLLVPLAALAVSAGGWLGPGLVQGGWVDAETPARDIFVAVAHALTRPGVFGLILAALTAALMSSADSLINAVSAVFVNDIYQPFFRARASDAHYLRVARLVSIAAAVVGIALVPLFMSFASIYLAHGAFTAAVTPPMVVTALLGLLWPRFGARAALWTLVGGSGAALASFIWPQLIAPFAHGTPQGGEGLKAFSYIRALYGLAVSGAIGVGVTLLTRAPTGAAVPRLRARVSGLVLGSIQDAIRRYKGAEPREEPSRRIRLLTRVDPTAAEVPDTDLLSEDVSRPVARPEVRLAPEDLARLPASPGDLLFVARPGWWHGGLKGMHARAGEPWPEPGRIRVPAGALRRIGVAPGRPVTVERIL